MTIRHQTSSSVFKRTALSYFHEHIMGRRIVWTPSDPQGELWYMQLNNNTSLFSLGFLFLCEWQRVKRYKWKCQESLTHKFLQVNDFNWKHLMRHWMYRILEVFPNFWRCGKLAGLSISVWSYQLFGYKSSCSCSDSGNICGDMGRYVWSLLWRYFLEVIKLAVTNWL